DEEGRDPPYPLAIFLVAVVDAEVERDRSEDRGEIKGPQRAPSDALLLQRYARRTSRDPERRADERDRGPTVEGPVRVNRTQAPERKPRTRREVRVGELEAFQQADRSRQEQPERCGERIGGKDASVRRSVPVVVRPDSQGLRYHRTPVPSMLLHGSSPDHDWSR